VTPPRTILYTGKGGVGKTSVAAATARACAVAGKRTLVLSTDPAHSLADSLQQPLGGEPTVVEANLWGQQIDAQQELTRHWAGVQGWMGQLLVDRGIDRISAEELTVPPGMDELFSLLRLQQHHDSGEWDVIIVDCAPTGETLRLLSFPDAARWWIDRVFPFERAILAAVGPLARIVLDIPVPGGEVFDDVRRLSENLISMHQILRDSEHTTIRLVLNPDRMVIGEAMRTFTYLNLYGYLTDAVVVNKVFPDGVGDYFDHWRGLQQQQLELVESAFAPVPVLRAKYFEQEVIGAQMLGRLGAEVFAGAGEPWEVLFDTITQEIISDEQGASLRIAIPFASKEEITLKQVGLELIITAAGQRRTIALPPKLAALQASAARYEEGVLQISFSRGSE
jgi:arsenite-transporting ATPase